MIRRFAGHDVYLAVISAGAPYAVHRWEESYLGRATWFVPRGEWTKYRAYHAPCMRPGSDQCVSVARNQALKAAFQINLPCLMLDDDPVGAFRVRAQRAERITWPELFSDLVKLHVEHGTSVSYANRNTNTHFIKDEFSFKPKLSTGCVIINPTDLRFDEELKLAEDMDYGLQHVETYGHILRADSLIAHMDMDTPDSICTKQRTPEVMAWTRQYLLAKWRDRVVYKRSPNRSDVQLRPKARRRERIT